MKKVVLIILMLVVIGGGIFIIKKSNKDLDIIKGKFTEKSKNITENLKDKEAENKNIVQKENVVSTFELRKIDSKEFTKNYKIEEQYKIIQEKYFKIEKQKENLVISIVESENNEELLSRGKGIECNRKYIINNVKSEDVKSVFTGGEGHDLVYPLVYILIKDGTIKGVDIENGYKTGKFEAQNISGIGNVEKINQASVSPENDSGYEAVVAITKDDTVYEIRKVER